MKTAQNEHCIFFFSESEISAFLASSKETERDASWMDDCRRQFCKIMATKSNTLTGYGMSHIQLCLKVTARCPESLILYWGFTGPNCRANMSAQSP